jgi:ComF family protein
MLAHDVARRAPPPAREYTWVIPVPLHPRRLRQRGFNPAAFLAAEIARSAGLSFEARWLVRLRDTPSQTGLGRQARRRNLAGAFACRRLPARASDVPQRVWLVDDVVTTGATLQSAARCLHEAGARQVLALCAARTSSSIEVQAPSG